MSFWNDTKIEQLKSCWRDGKSASVIAAEIGAISRSAVIGKLHREGLNARTDTPQKIRVRKKRTAPKSAGNTSMKNHHIDREQQAIAKRLAQEAREKARNLPDLEPLIRFIDVADHGQCKWIPASEHGYSARCCGRPSEPGLSYCATHSARAYDAVKPKHNSQLIMMGTLGRLHAHDRAVFAAVEEFSK